MNLSVETFFDRETSTATHVVWDKKTRHSAVIDSVRDFDPKSGCRSTASADAIIDFIGAQDLAVDGSQFDQLFEDGAVFHIGELEVKVIHTPGHTPACVSYLINDTAFVGDTLFMPDYGTARCDFPGGDARHLYRSIQKKFLSLAMDTRLFMCHDYTPDGRGYAWQTTVAAERAENIHIHDGIREDDFVQLRTEREQALDMPVLILPSVQVNMRAGHLPPPENNGIHYLKIPVDALEQTNNASGNDHGKHKSK